MIFCFAALNFVVETSVDGDDVSSLMHFFALLFVPLFILLFFYGILPLERYMSAVFGRLPRSSLRLLFTLFINLLLWLS